MKSLEDQLWDRVKRGSGVRAGGGYGRLKRPEGGTVVLDHLCRNPPCCNPAHLEPVTERENILRGISPTARFARRTHCKNGHPLTGPNNQVRADGRRCRVCQWHWNRAYEVERIARRRAAAEARRQAPVTPLMSDDLITATEAAALLGISKWRVREMTRDGRLPRVVGPFRIRVPVEAAMRLLAEKAA